MDEAVKIDLDGGAVLYVQPDDSGPSLVADQDLEGGFEMVSGAIETVGRDLRAALVAIAPEEASVELGFNLTVEAGRLVALLVGKGSGSASIKVTLTWKASPDGAKDAATPVGG